MKNLQTAQVAFRPLMLGLAILFSVPTATAGQSGGASPGPEQRVILVTGSTSGLGREVARALAADGDHVIIHGRSVDRGTALVEEINSGSAGSARFYQVDFASLNEVRHLAEVVMRDYDRLDVLVNNAGVLFFGEDEERRLSSDGYELTFQVNYLAGYLLTDLLLPLVQESAPARVVNVSSLAASPLDFDDLMLESGYSGIRAYNQSKLAQVMYTMEIAERLQGTGVTVNALHPGTFMDTNMVLSAGIQPRSSVEDGRDRVMELINGDSMGTGHFYVDGERSKTLDPQPYDAEARARLLTETLRLIGN